MPSICAVVSCKTRMEKKAAGVRLFCFPKVNQRYSSSSNEILAKRRKAWVAALKRGNFTEERIDKLRICSLHFIEGKPAKFQEVDHPDWVPSVEMGYIKRAAPSEQRLSRYKRRSERNSIVPLEEDDMVSEPMDLNRSGEIEVYSENFEVVMKSPSQTVFSEDDSDDTESTTSLPRTPQSFSTLLKLKIERQAVEIDILKREKEELRSKLHSVKSELNAVNEGLKLELSELNAENEELRLQSSELNAENEGLRLEVQSIKTELVTRNDENYSLRGKLKRFSYCSESFSTEKDEKKLLFYSGIPNIDVFNVILRHLNAGSTKLCDISTSLDSFQILLLVLMKLRLATSFHSLGYKFGICERTASAVFQKGIILMYHVLHRFIHWPTREELLNAVPQCFLDTFGEKVAVIIDCFEIAIQKPASLKVRAETFSQYKQKNTLKYLIGIAPCGAVSFISEGWGGRTSDEHLIENSGILDLLEPGDVVLADRGFTVSQEVGLRYATLKTPAFTEGKPQLAPRALEESRKVSSVRIHVERVIGTLRNKFKILNGPVPITLLSCHHNGKPIFDYIVFVCCALTNMCDSIVIN